MLHYIIDGNNLIGKIKSLKYLQKNNRQSSRIGLASILNKYFSGKKIKLTLHLDGYPNESILLSKGKIIYSERKTSDSKIKEEINHSKNPKLIVLVSSDRNLMEYGKVNSCKIIKSEDFKKLMDDADYKGEETEKVKQLENEKEIFLELFTKKSS